MSVTFTPALNYRRLVPDGAEFFVLSSVEEDHLLEPASLLKEPRWTSVYRYIEGQDGPEIRTIAGYGPSGFSISRPAATSYDLIVMSPGTSADALKTVVLNYVESAPVESDDLFAAIDNYLLHQRVVNDLKSGDRKNLASKVLRILQGSREDPREPDVVLVSLRAMAAMMLREREFADPVLGLDPLGLVQIEWDIIGDGLLLMAFLEDERVHCVVQADAYKGAPALDESERLIESEALSRFSHLVPRRS